MLHGVYPERASRKVRDDKLPNCHSERSEESFLKFSCDSNSRSKNLLDEKHWQRTRLLFGPTAMNSEVDPSAVRILDTVLGSFIGFRVDLCCQAGFLQSP